MIDLKENEVVGTAMDTIRARFGQAKTEKLVNAIMEADQLADLKGEYQDMVRYGIGTVSNVNYFGGTGNLPFPKFSGGRGMAGKTIHTELAAGGRVRIERMMVMAKYGKIHPELLITHRLTGLDKIEEALYLMKDKPADLIKAAVAINLDR